ncbi:MAG: hypothetical protein JNM63_00035, partial [Spirochaetia bacterium]|nr:hypothetical protein [Spirochaetia bacterium]
MLLEKINLFKNALLTFALAALLSCVKPSPTDPGFVWTWKPGPKPIVLAKEDSLYEGKAIGSPDVLRDGDLFAMYYAQGGKDDKGRIGLALSRDGVNWSKVANGKPILEPGPSGAWDSWFLDTPGIVKSGGGYFLYYVASRSNGTVGASIGLATSANGTDFTRYSGNPVLTRGAVGSWEELWIESPVILKDSSGFKMYYSGVDAKWQVRIGLATSPDGTNWTKYSGNPILSTGKESEWDSYAVAVPAVLKKGNIYQMFYCGQATWETALGFKAPKIGYASSTDGVNWKKGDFYFLSGWETYAQPNGPWTPTALFDEAAGEYK